VVRAYAAAVGVLADAALAEDAVAQTFIQIWEAPERYDSRLSSVSGWVAMIARSRATDLLRRKRRHQALRLRKDGHLDSHDGTPVTDMAVLATSMAEVLDSVSESERRGVLVSALAALPIDQRRALECAFFDGLSYAEVATRLGAPLGTIKTRIRSALSILRTRLVAVGIDVPRSIDPEAVE
jgi:RNA polymerase sigma-70 factor (ECF subfamily)